MRIDALRFLEDLSGRYARPYTDAVQDMVIALATEDRPGYIRARDRLGEVIRDTMGAAELLGASLVLREAAGHVASMESTVGGMAASAARAGDMLQFDAQPTQTLIPNVTLLEAANRLVKSTPVTLRDAAARTAQRIGELYRTGNVAAFARSAEQVVTERVQKLIAESYAEGLGEVEVGRQIRLTVDQVREQTAEWSEAYSRMAFRTNVNTATNAGRFRQVQDPDMGGLFPALEFMPIGDADTRDNHLHARGIYGTNSPVWDRIAPPLGYSCRCTTRPVSRIELEGMGRLNEDGTVRDDFLDPRAGPDPGFAHSGRPVVTA